MLILVLLILISLLIAIGFFLAFTWAVHSGQYDDTDAPAVRMLFEDQARNKED